MGTGERPGLSETESSYAASVKAKVSMTLKLAVQLIGARIGFRAGEAGAVGEDDPVLKGGANFYLQDGKVYRTKIHKDVPCNHSITDIQDYVNNLPQDHVVQYTEAKDFPQYKGILDFVTTCRVACEPKGSAFTWPKEPRSFVSAFTVAVTHLPPGYTTSIRNSEEIPDWVRRSSEREPVGERLGVSEAIGTATRKDRSGEDWSCPKPDKASSTWAGKWYQPWWWKGNKED